ncbi:hypothetical protein EDP2_3914 [Enterobacter cloacae S611]|uniref:Uncharacterized protein n=1 Tax=Enterobacter cloacae S611 TaxID=1399146 RepID=A0ABP2ZY92_ENTCL|nr:hypothetical protein EDP2_3914 [Enterobacter cloacae S611]
MRVNRFYLRNQNTGLVNIKIYNVNTVRVIYMQPNNKIINLNTVIKLKWWYCQPNVIIWINTRKRLASYFLNNTCVHTDTISKL